MKALSEEEIQQLLEQQLKEGRMQELPGNDRDTALYQLLFTALAAEPETSKNIDLAEAVVKQIKMRQQKAESLRYSMVIAAVLVAGIIGAYFSINYVSPTVVEPALNFMITYKWIFAFVIFCVGLIEIADRKLVIGHSAPQRPW
jgi:hypothetical protein